MEKQISIPFEFPRSHEQNEAYEAFMSGKSVALDACAGSGKSHISHWTAKNYASPADFIPHGRAMCEKEATSFAGFSHINSLNFHRRGLRLCGNVEIDSNKLYHIAETLDDENSVAIAALTRFFKIEGVGTYESSLTPEEIAVKYGIETKHIGKAINALRISDEMQNIVDFDDMLRFPVIGGKRCIAPGAIFLDEVQDYNPASFDFLVKCIYDGNQVFMVGDYSRQCLMMFAGANPALFGKMADFFKCEEYSLTYNRRCAKNIVKHAPFKGNMQALPDAPDGIVGSIPLNEFMPLIKSDKHDDDAVLSETNAPLVSLGINLLSQKIPVRMRTERLTRTLNRFTFGLLDTRKIPVGKLTEAMERRRADALAEGTEVSKEFEDAVQCVASLETYCLAEGIVKPAWQYTKGRKAKPIHPIHIALDKLTKCDNGITLMTGHTAKGQEYTRVYHMAGSQRQAEHDWQNQQNNCLAHVIATRAKSEHYTVTAAND